MICIPINILPSSFFLADKPLPCDVLHRNPVFQAGGELDLGALCR